MPEKIFRACLTWSHKEVSQARNGDSLLQVKEEHMQTPHGQEGARNVQDWKEGWTVEVVCREESAPEIRLETGVKWLSTSGGILDIRLIEHVKLGAM